MITLQIGLEESGLLPFPLR